MLYIFIRVGDSLKLVFLIKSLDKLMVSLFTRPMGPKLPSANFNRQIMHSLPNTESNTILPLGFGVKISSLEIIKGLECKKNQHTPSPDFPLPIINLHVSS